MGLPDHREAAAADGSDQQVAAIAQRIAGTKLPALAELPAQPEDLAVDLAGVDRGVAQLLAPRPRGS